VPVFPIDAAIPGVEAEVRETLTLCLARDHRNGLPNRLMRHART